MMMNVLKMSCFVISAFALLECTSKGEQKKPDAVSTFPVVSLRTRTAEIHRLYVGDLQAFRNVEVRARVQGYLEKNFVDEGKQVKKDQILFQLSNEEYEAQLMDAEGSLKKAIAEAKASELELKRVELLVDKKVISDTELQLAKAKLDAFNASIEKARSSIEHAKTKLSYTTIRAPFDGVIDRIPYKIGSLITEGTLLTTVSDITSINAYFNVSENDYLELAKDKFNKKAGESAYVNLILSDGKEYAYEGLIEKIDGEFQENTGTMSFRAKFPNPEKVLKHGSSGTIRITRNIDHALIVPQKSTFEVQDKVYVFKLTDSNKVRMTNFVPQKRFSDYYIVDNGLKTGDLILYEGIQKVKDGMRIVPQEVPLDSLSASTTFNHYLK